MSDFADTPELKAQRACWGWQHLMGLKLDARRVAEHFRSLDEWKEERMKSGFMRVAEKDALFSVRDE